MKAQVQKGGWRHSSHQIFTLTRQSALEQRWVNVNNFRINFSHLRVEAPSSGHLKYPNNVFQKRTYIKTILFIYQTYWPCKKKWSKCHEIQVITVLIRNTVNINKSSINGIILDLYTSWNKLTRAFRCVRSYKQALTLVRSQVFAATAKPHSWNLKKQKNQMCFDTVTQEFNLHSRSISHIHSCFSVTKKVMERTRLSWNHLHICFEKVVTCSLWRFFFCTSLNRNTDTISTETRRPSRPVWERWPETLISVVCSPELSHYRNNHAAAKHPSVPKPTKNSKSSMIHTIIWDFKRRISSGAAESDVRIPTLVSQTLLLSRIQHDH